MKRGHLFWKFLRKAVLIVAKNSEKNGYWAARLESQAAAEGQETPAAAIGAWVEPYPRLRSFLLGGSVNGTLVQGGTVLLSVSPDGAKIGLHDRHCDKWAWTTLVGDLTPLEAAEELAGSDPSRWRASKPLSKTRY